MFNTGKENACQCCHGLAFKDAASLRHWLTARVSWLRTLEPFAGDGQFDAAPKARRNANQGFEREPLQAAATQV